MNGSLKIGTAFGIPIRIHWTFLVLIYLFALTVDAPLWVLALGITGIFGSVLLHELGHSLVAKSFGIRVIDITFWPLGGMARMNEIPESPRIEGLVAIAGPLVNLALAGLGAAVWVPSEFLGLAIAGLAAQFIVINLLMGIFNLVPAFPMDGGRILRAWLARSADWVTATEQAVAVGRVFAAIMFIGSIVAMTVVPGLCAMPLIAVFVWIAGGRELWAVRMRHRMEPFGGVRVRVFEQAAPESAPDPGQEGHGAHRPSAWGGPGSRGFTEQDVREMERFRGRLRPPQADE